MKLKALAFLTLLSITSAHAATRSTETAELGKPVKDLQVTDTNGKIHKLSEYKGKTVVLEWTNYGCPFVRKHYDSGNMQALQSEETAKGVVWLSVASTHEGHKDYLNAKAMNERIAQEKNKATATLLDPKGELGTYFGAKTTPHVFILNEKSELVYRGAIDDKPSTDIADVKSAKNYVRAAIDDLRAGRKIAEASTTAYGCGVKYP